MYIFVIAVREYTQPTNKYIMKSKILVDYDFNRNETFLQLRLEGWDVDGGELVDKHLKNFIEQANNAGGLEVFYNGAGNGLPQIRIKGSTATKQSYSESEKGYPVTDELLKAANPLMDYLQKNHHPHVTAIVDSLTIEVFEGLQVANKL